MRDFVCLIGTIVIRDLFIKQITENLIENGHMPNLVFSKILTGKPKL